MYTILKSAVLGCEKETNRKFVGKESLRVLQVVPQLRMGGTELALLNVVSGLENISFEHGLCTVRDCDAHLQRLSAFSNVFVLGEKSKGRHFALPRLMNIMKKYRPHIVHSHNWGAIEAVPAARLAGVSAVVHSEHGYELDNMDGLPLRRRLIRRAFYPMADVVFTVTHELRNYHARQAWVSPKRIQVIYNGVDTHRFAPRDEIRRRTRQELNLPPESFVIGSVGRLVKIKDHATLLRAGQMLIRRGVNAYILLAGSGPESTGLQDLANGAPELHDRVHFLGTCTTVPDLLNAMDVFVLPSISEGMSNTLLEAMACALPVLATDVGGNPEVIETERNGCLFSVGDVNQLTARLDELARNADLRRRFGAASRRRAVEVFSLEHMLQQYRQLYFDLAVRHGITQQRAISNVRN